MIGDTSYILRIGLVMLGVSLLQVGSSIAAVYFGARTAMGFGRDLRSAVFRRVGDFSSREVASFGAPSLITRNTNDVQQVQMLVLMSLTMMVMAPVMMVGGIVMALREDIGPFGTLLYTGHDWADGDLSRRSMELMANEVWPRVVAASG